MFNQNYFETNENMSDLLKLLLTPCYKDVSLIGQFYINSVENDDFFSQANLMLLRDFFIYPNSDIFTTIDDLTLSYKALQTLSKSSFNHPVSLTTFSNLPSSYLSVFNNFRADFEDFNFVNTESILQNFSNTSVNDYNTLLSTQLSNLLMVRNNVKNSVITYNALRKVFKARFDEGRSNTSLHFFSQLALPQPFISYPNINYSQLLSKDVGTFYGNILYKNITPKILNTTFANSTSQNFYFYDLPFLLSEGSDSQKFM